MFSSKHHNLQKILFGEIVFDDDFCKILKLLNDVKENDDFKNAKIYKIYKDINDVINIGSTCDTLSKCMSKFRIKSKSRVNWSDDKFYKMIRISYINCKIELIEHFPRNNADELICKKNEVFDKLINEIKNKQINKLNKYV
jgi:hypothetical protein